MAAVPVLAFVCALGRRVSVLSACGLFSGVGGRKCVRVCKHSFGVICVALVHCVC